ncbi:MAG: thioredoxin domain-containing protein [Nitrospirota bacterium]
MRKLFEKISSKKYWISTIISLIGIGIVLPYGICGESCSYPRGSIFSIDLKYLGVLYMGMLILFNPLRRSFIFLFLLSFGLGAEIYLLGFQIRNLIQCYYCLAFGAIIIILFLLNFDMSKKILMTASLILGFILFLIFFQGIVTPLYAEEVLLPSFGTGKIKVRLYTDYFCGPCRSLEPRLEEIITDLVKKNIINITFVDTPIHPQTNLYARYFLYVLNENKKLNHALEARAALFEAAKNKITKKEKLEEFLKKRNIGFRPFEVASTFSLLNSYFKEDKINATPMCVISNGEKKNFTGADEIIQALEHLK